MSDSTRKGINMADNHGLLHKAHVRSEFKGPPADKMTKHLNKVDSGYRETMVSLFLLGKPISQGHIPFKHKHTHTDAIAKELRRKS